MFKFIKKLKLSFVTAIALLLLSNTASADLAGGLGNVQSQLSGAQTALMAIGAIAAGLYLLYKAVECWRGRADWGEFGMAIVYVGLAGASIKLAQWAWTMFAG